MLKSTNIYSFKFENLYLNLSFMYHHDILTLFQSLSVSCCFTHLIIKNNNSRVRHQNINSSRGNDINKKIYPYDVRV